MDFRDCARARAHPVSSTAFPGGGRARPTSPPSDRCPEQDARAELTHGQVYSVRYVLDCSNKSTARSDYDCQTPYTFLTTVRQSSPAPPRCSDTAPPTAATGNNRTSFVAAEQTSLFSRLRTEPILPLMNPEVSPFSSPRRLRSPPTLRPVDHPLPSAEICMHRSRARHFIQFYFPSNGQSSAEARARDCLAPRKAGMEWKEGRSYFCPSRCRRINLQAGGPTAVVVRCCSTSMMTP